MNLARLFKAYDIRGVYPEDLDEVAAHAIGAAFARFVRDRSADKVIVGRDMRLSSPALSSAFVEGVTGQAIDVIDVGLVSTDALYFASGEFSAPGAMFTASHNPGEYNGIKLCLAGAAPVGEETGLAEVRRLAEKGVPPAERAGVVAERDVLDAFAQHLLNLVSPGLIKPLRVAVDAANGMGGVVVPLVLGKLEVEIIPLFFELDGSFPNHPADPIQVDNLRDLRDAVIEVRADLGLAFDGDADRVFLVDEKAEPVSGSLTTALVASRILRKEPGASIIHNVICSRVVPEVIEEFGGKPIRTRVGHSFIKQRMAETGAAFGGEHSGHYYFRDNFRADSGLLCALYVLEALSAEERPFSEVLAPFKRYWNSGEINSEVADQDVKMKELSERFSDGTQDWMDGLTVDYATWWFNVRPSNTEPLLRMNVEARDPQIGEERTKEILDVIRE